MTILKDFPPAQLISPRIVLKPGDLDYSYLLSPSAFTLVNAGISGYVFYVLNYELVDRRVGDNGDFIPLETRIVIPREGKIWVVWSAGREHSKLVCESAEACKDELIKIAQRQEALHLRKQEACVSIDPDNFVPRTGLLTRYGKDKKVFRGKFQEGAKFSKNRPYGIQNHKIVATGTINIPGETDE